MNNTYYIVRILNKLYTDSNDNFSENIVRLISEIKDTELEQS